VPWQFPPRDAIQAPEGILARAHKVNQICTLFHDERYLESWLRLHGAPEASTEEALCECAYARLRASRIELPAEAELRRMVRAALHGFFDDLYERVTAQLSETVRAALDALLVVGPDETQSAFDRLKAEPSAPGVKPLQQELAKLHTLRAIGVPAASLATIPFKVLQLLKRRATNERASEMRAGGRAGRRPAGNVHRTLCHQE
jgi:hypothetical protein